MSENRSNTEQTREAGEVARLLSYVLIFAISVFLFVDARSLPTSRWEVLGSGAFPQIVFGVLIILSVIAAIDAVLKIPRAAFVGFVDSIAKWVKTRYLVILIFGCFALYLPLIPLLGFSLATFLFLIVVQAILAPRTRLALILGLIIAVVFSFGLNFVFDEVFNVFLPRGVLFNA